MSLYVYASTAPVASVTLRLGDGSCRDVTLHPGARIDLPDGHAYVTRLLHRGLLTAAPAPTPAPAPAPKKASAPTPTTTAKEA
jgi:hypothetical protein